MGESRKEKTDIIDGTMKVYEFSKKMGISASKLRYYDRLGLIEGNRKDNNYRDFTKEDVLSVYHTQLLRSYGMGLDELRIQKDADIEGVGQFLEDNIDRTIQEIKRQELLLMRLRTMKSFHELFYGNPECIHERYLSPNYRIETFGNHINNSENDWNDVQIIAENLPFSYVSVQVTKESLSSGNEELDVHLGVGILKEISDSLNLTLQTHKFYEGGNIMEQLLEVEDPFAIKRSDLKPLLNRMQEMNLPYTELAGRIYCSYKKEGKLVHGLGLATIISDGKM